MEVELTLEQSDKSVLKRNYKTVHGADMCRGIFATKMHINAHIGSKEDMDRFIYTLETIKHSLK